MLCQMGCAAECNRSFVHCKKQLVKLLRSISIMAGMYSNPLYYISFIHDICLSITCIYNVHGTYDIH